MRHFINFKIKLTPEYLIQMTGNNYQLLNLLNQSRLTEHFNFHKRCKKKKRERDFNISPPILHLPPRFSAHTQVSVVAGWLHNGSVFKYRSHCLACIV